MKAPKLSGPGTLSEIEGFLDDITVPLRLAAISPEGWPVIASLWFEYHDGAFYCASKKHSRIVKLLQKKIANRLRSRGREAALLWRAWPRSRWARHTRRQAKTGPWMLAFHIRS